MNKQELIEKLKSDLTAMSEIKGKKYEYDKGYELAIKEHLAMISNLDWPEKPVVPQFVADWYENNKDDLEYNLYKLCTDFREQKLRADLHGWFNDDNHKCIETLVKMKLFGYEVEKEKLYIVEIPNPNDFIDNHSRLARNYKGKVVLEVQDWLNTDESYELTEAEIKEDFDWAWQFAKEVKE